MTPRHGVLEPVRDTGPCHDYGQGEMGHLFWQQCSSLAAAGESPGIGAEPSCDCTRRRAVGGLGWVFNGICPLSKVVRTKGSRRQALVVSNEKEMLNS